MLRSEKMEQKNEIVLIDNAQAQTVIETLRSNGYAVKTRRFISGSRQYVLVEWK